MQQPTSYRSNIAIIAHRDGEFLVINRYNDEPGTFKFPQGGVEEHDDDLVQAGVREFAEELGTDKLEVLGVSEHTNRYDWDAQGIARHEQKTGKTYKGQHQRFLVAHFTGSDDELELCDQEVEEHYWISREQVLGYDQQDDHEHFRDYNGTITRVLEEFGL